MTHATCVLFDLYGTLADVRLNEDAPRVWEGMAAAVRASGGSVAGSFELRDRFRRILGEECERRQEGFIMEPVFARLLASCGARPDVASLGRVFRELSLEKLSVRSYVAPLFAALRRASYAFAIVSNTEAVLTRFDLDRCPILLSANTIVLSSEVGVRKPDPRTFQIALDRLHADASTAIVVGNSVEEDIAGACQANLRAIFVDEHATRVEPWPSNPSVVRSPPAGEALAEALRGFGCDVSLAPA